MLKEKFYVVKEVSRATRENKNFADEVQTLLYGKKDYKLYWDGSHDGWNDQNWMTPYFVREHAYKRECNAKKNWAYNNPEISQWWHSRTEIVPVEIHEDNGKEYLVY